MAERQQGTGRHPHKDTKEPLSHRKENDSRQARDDTRQTQGRDRGSRVGGSHDSAEDADLKRREYRGDDGEIHHHTRTYMEQHRGEREQVGSQSGGQSRDPNRRDR
jgi:hypothetical protein